MYKISLNFTVTFIPKEMAILVIRPFILINLLLLLLLFFYFVIFMTVEKLFVDERKLWRVERAEGCCLRERVKTR